MSNYAFPRAVARFLSRDLQLASAYQPSHPQALLQDRNKTNLKIYFLPNNSDTEIRNKQDAFACASLQLSGNVNVKCYPAVLREPEHDAGCLLLAVQH